MKYLSERVDILTKERDDRVSGIGTPATTFYALTETPLERDGADDDFVVAACIHKQELQSRVDEKMKNSQLLFDSNAKYFLICDSVYRASALVKIGVGFTGRTLKDIKFGKYTYLMGPHRMIRFQCFHGLIAGVYYDEQAQIGLVWGVDIATGDYCFSGRYSKEFSMIMQVLTFIELGDIEIEEIPGGRSNNKNRKEGKITNESKNTVFVVDSSWNKLIIRTEGFAVRGHFKLQPCGPQWIDRKLIWVNAFEKHGYIRKPRAEIVRN